MSSRSILLALLIAASLSGCGDKAVDPVISGAESLVGTWVGSGFTLVVARDLTWRGSGQLRYECGMPETCSYPIDVEDVVKHLDARFYVVGAELDALGSYTELGGSWNEERTLFTGHAAFTRSGVRNTVPLTLRKAL